MVMGALSAEEGARYGGGAWQQWFDELRDNGRAVLLERDAQLPLLWLATERHAEFLHLWGGAAANLEGPSETGRRFAVCDHDDEMVSLLRARLDCSGPQTATGLAETLGLPLSNVDTALRTLEQRGIVFHGQYTPGRCEMEWCDRRVIARIHRYTMQRLRAEIEPVPASVFMRFLFDWQCVSEDTKVEGVAATAAILEQLSGFECAAGTWEDAILPARVRNYSPDVLDQLHTSGHFVWLRLNLKRGSGGRSAGPLKSTPLSIVPRADVKSWLTIVDPDGLAADPELSGAATMVMRILRQSGAAFFDDIVDRCGILKSQCEQALGELAAAGFVTSDSFAGLRLLLTPPSRRRPLNGSPRRGVGVAGLDSSGRWDLLPRSNTVEAPVSSDGPEIECIARTLLNRYGVVFKRVLERETGLPPWRYLLWALRRMEARGELRGGRFVAGFSGEQFALPAAVAQLRKLRKSSASREIIVLSAADPLNLAGIITPGLRIPSKLHNRIAFLEGEPVGIRLGEEVRMLKTGSNEIECRVRTELIKNPRSRIRRRYARRR